MRQAPARKITNKGSKKRTGFFPSDKNECLVAYESPLELDYFYLLEFDRDVIRYREQPLKISFVFSNKTHRYTPDLEVQRKSGKQLVEVKPWDKLQELLKDDLEVSKFKAAANFCKYNGYSGFRIVTDKEIRSGTYLKNIKYLFSFHNRKVPASVKLTIRNELIANGQQQISQIIEKICPDENLMTFYYSYVLSLLYHHEVCTDLKKPINKSSLVYFNA
jgi:TnsA endonuclease N terminal.